MSTKTFFRLLSSKYFHYFIRISSLKTIFWFQRLGRNRSVRREIVHEVNLSNFSLIGRVR